MGLSKRVALVATASVMAASAQAADLGGNCCADLEERVAELEATTVRKGNRNVSLQLYGHVNEMIMIWDDGHEKNAYVGTNDDSRSRFGFKGKAKINSDWSAGFVMEFGLRAARSDRWNADQDSDPDDPQFDVRKSAWYLQSSKFGKLTVGRDSTVDSIAVSLANINAPIRDDMNDRFLIRTPGGGFASSGARWDRTVPLWSYNAPSRTRQNMIRYDTPTFQGFTVSANWGEDDYWAVALRYANEFNGVRVAAATSYSWLNEPDSETGCTDNGGPNASVDCEAWGVGGSVMHVATGLFVNAWYGHVKDNLRDPSAVSDTDDWWLVQFGIERKWNSLGKTTIYGTYFTGENNFGITSGAPDFERASQDMWSVGINQRIDAAAMDLYLAYYHWDADLTLVGGANLDTEAMQAVVTGAKIKF